MRKREFWITLLGFATILALICFVKAVHGAYTTVTTRIVQNRTVWGNYNFKAFCDGVPIGEGGVGVEFTYGGDCNSFEIKEKEY